MSTYPFDEYTRVWWLTSVASISAPTTVEIAAGVELTTFVSKSGLKVGTTNNVVKNDNISTAFSAEIPGTYGNKLSLECLRDNSADTAWTTIGIRGVAGFLVVRRGVLYTTAATAAQKAEVYPAKTMQPIIGDSAENARVMFTCEMTVTSTPNLVATIA